ncbi:MAG TPA: hypothetical protein VGH05_03750 [Buttiauxella sp.]
MSFQQVLNEVNVIKTAGNAYVVTSRYSQKTTEEFLLIDLSNQGDIHFYNAKDLGKKCEQYNCYQLALFTHGVSSVFVKMINKYCDAMLLNARMDMMTMQGYNYFIEMGEQDLHEGYSIWVPSLRKRMTQHKLFMYDPTF